MYAKETEDLEYVQWGPALPVRKVETRKDPFNPDKPAPPTYRMLMRNIPPGEQFQVKVSDEPHLMGDVSTNSSMVKSLSMPVAPAVPSHLRLHRTDPRLNHKKHDGTVCVDLHWSHPHPQLRRQPDDVYFRITYNGRGEPPTEYCADRIGNVKHQCGTPLPSASAELPLSYETLCGLRPNRTLRFALEAFNCDGQRAEATLTAVTPPSGPSMMVEMVTHPREQESAAGFKPTVIVDWVPQIDPLIEGHAVYLGLADIFAAKLICWLPRTMPGKMEVPIIHKNDTHSTDGLLLHDYWGGTAVHQEQELMVATRTAYYIDGVKVGHLESPASRYRLGDWHILEEAVKCLTSFEAPHSDYVTYPVTLSWTQQEAISRYD